MQKGSNRLLSVEAVFGRERPGVDAVEVAIRRVLDQVLDLVYRLGSADCRNAAKSGMSFMRARPYRCEVEVGILSG